ARIFRAPDLGRQKPRAARRLHDGEDCQTPTRATGAYGDAGAASRAAGGDRSSWTDAPAAVAAAHGACAFPTAGAPPRSGAARVAIARRRRCTRRAPHGATWGAGARARGRHDVRDVDGSLGRAARTSPPRGGSAR